ncbi:MAG TPA: MBL fold metallo-hydrolase [Ureibacillus sp.]|uniref:MBL fold metallo-hydrolase n=1 Tax=Peribacillus asahii TaxID=228899 RepID=UPI002079E7B6|nr:MBL fold metallo-hydrolase [Peribacillus asahii]USK57956.1 MBL fold metallo-hydrolase [Peribacillus asahii]HWL25679.1 MBL fold metallo-hydrolase [Ureibacillus sp.]
MKKRYENLDNVSNMKSMKDLWKWQKERRQKKKDLLQQIPHAEQKQVKRLQANRSHPSITWIGHSTFLLQLNGLNILTDPVWTNRQGIQKRQTEPGILLEDLPEIDVVVISHGHYDHLDFGSIRRLKGKPAFYIPHGLKKAFVRRGYRDIYEANWWDSFQVGEVTLSFVPAQHWTRRTLFDTNTSHWGGWVLQNEKISFYFVGDTGYFRGFQEIAEKFKFQYVLMPIGAYEPEWFMSDSHINPEDAVRAFLEVSGEFFIPMHYGAYRLADDTGPEALERLNQEWERQQLPEEQLKILRIGETLWCSSLLS